VKPIPKLDVQACSCLRDGRPEVGYGTAGLPVAYSNGTYGTEIDVTGTYKITNNLSYMLGFGYLFTGDYYQANAPNSGNSTITTWSSTNLLLASKSRSVVLTVNLKPRRAGNLPGFFNDAL